MHCAHRIFMVTMSNNKYFMWMDPMLHTLNTLLTEPNWKECFVIPFCFYWSGKTCVNICWCLFYNHTMKFTTFSSPSLLNAIECSRSFYAFFIWADLANLKNHFSLNWNVVSKTLKLFMPGLTHYPEMKRIELVNSFKKSSSRFVYIIIRKKFPYT